MVEAVISNGSIVTVEARERIAIITLNRPEKRNAFSAALFDAIDAAFVSLAPETRAVVLAGNGRHFCAGLDLAEHQMATPFESVLYSRRGHEIFRRIQHGGRPVVCAMQGAVIGGGLEMACSAHVRVAERSTFYELPEGRRGIFLGGGGTVRVSRIIGPGRLTEMMLTGRRLLAEEGQHLGLSHYLVEEGEALTKAIALAETVASNAPISNYMMLEAVAMIGEMGPEAGLFAESVSQAVTLTSEDARAGMEAFLQKKNIAF